MQNIEHDDSTDCVEEPTAGVDGLSHETACSYLTIGDILTAMIYMEAHYEAVGWPANVPLHAGHAVQLHDKTCYAM